jgi:predicted Zn-dependent protease
VGCWTEHEFEADDFGTQYAARAGYDPRGLESYLKKMSYLQLKEEKLSPLERQQHRSIFGYEHPDTFLRLYLQTYEAEYWRRKGIGSKVGKRRYQKVRDGCE